MTGEPEPAPEMPAETIDELKDCYEAAERGLTEEP
jgi:hypothetical protein